MANFDMGSLGDYIREQRRSAHISLRQLAESAGVSNPYLSQIERGLRKPSADILQQIAKGLRISAEALYVQAGILSHDAPGAEVPAAIRSDAVMTERQKQVLLEIYESFRGENRAADVGSGESAHDTDGRREAADRVAGSDDDRTATAATENGDEQPSDVWQVETDQPW